MIASVAGFIRAAPPPCTIRQAISSSPLSASPQNSDAIVNTMMPTTKMRRRPSRSANFPPVSISAAKLSA